jgi:hypothetical protein
VIDTLPYDAAVNDRAALPPGMTCPLNVSVTGDVAVGDVVVAASSQAASTSAARTLATSRGPERECGIMGG